jgi:hypothetical protein
MTGNPFSPGAASDPDVPLEEIVGYRGAFLASYVVRFHGTFSGYTKIFTLQPETVWDTAGALHKVTCGVRPTAREALIHSRILAEHWCDDSVALEPFPVDLGPPGTAREAAP